MENSKLIWSDKPKWWFLRHFSFWFFWYLYFGTLHALQPFASQEHGSFQNLGYTLPEAALTVSIQAIMVYPLLYFVLPRFVFKNRYITAIGWIIVFFALATFVNWWFMVKFNQLLLDAILPASVPRIKRPKELTGFMGYLSTLKGGLVCVGLALSLKLTKYWHLKEKHNMSLLREKTEAQIKLLTAQIHPHFLFNTLNNIYSQTQSESPKGSAMIIELAEILRYTLGEGQKQFVPLANELNLLRNYINLEKVRYGNNLKLHVEMPVETGDWQIAPLLLLPFLENCFKHGTSKFLQEPWIKLQISLEDATLNFKLMNGKDVSQANKATQSGIGNANVRTRLELLYPDKHNLTIVDEEDVYIVQLRLQLDNKQRSNRISENLIPKPAYA